MKKSIKDSLDKNHKEIEFKLTCIDQLGKAAHAAGLNIEWETMETNGWQWDYWVQAMYKKQKYTISGSGYYGWGKITRND